MQRGPLRYDLPRQMLIAFLGAVAVTAVIGLMISVLDQISPDEIARAEVRGDREGRIDGYEAAFQQGRAVGATSAARDLDALLTTGDPEAGRTEAYDFAWNDAIDIALERSRRSKLEVESAFDEWEALRR